MREHSSPAAGFTLLEVMVALVIVALGLMAAFGQVNQSLNAASRLRTMTLAHWIAVDQITRLRVLGEFPAIGSSSDEVEMANTRWVYKTKVTKADLETLRVIDVSVALADSPDSVITTVTGVIGAPQETPPPGVNVGWPPLDPAS
jgi:general secretion pathway protein I